MKEEITVDKAINRGHLIVNIPVFITMMGVPALAIYLANINIISNWGILIGFILGFSLAWLVWSFMITKWRIWAFENVRNVHELKKRAIDEKLIWNDRNIFEKSEIRSSFENQKLKELERKFENDDVFKEDFSVPTSTTIYYSKATNLIEMAIMLLCFGVGIYLLLTSDSYIIGTIFTIIGGYFAYQEYKQATNTEPQIIIDSKGIKTINIEFIAWTEIKNEEVIYEISGKSSKSYLSFDYKNGSEYILIDDFDITPKKLENILKTYRIRNNKNYR